MVAPFAQNSGFLVSCPHSLFNVKLCTSHLFCIYLHVQCRLQCIHHVEFYFCCSHQITAPVHRQLLYGYQGERSSEKIIWGGRSKSFLGGGRKIFEVVEEGLDMIIDHAPKSFCMCPSFFLNMNTVIVGSLQVTNWIWLFISWKELAGNNKVSVISN